MTMDQSALNDMMTEVQLYMIETGQPPRVRAVEQFVVAMIKDSTQSVNLLPSLDMMEHYQLEMMVGGADRTGMDELSSQRSG